jgi:ankyrin repeat protein/actin-like ATPase involved in cell morphogenesis
MLEITKIIYGGGDGRISRNPTGIRSGKPFRVTSRGVRYEVFDFPHASGYCEHAISVDFGTSNSAVVWINPKSGMPEVIRNEHGEEKTPSVIYRGVDGTLVGKPALDQLADVAHMDEEERLEVLGRTFMSVKRLLKDNLPLALPDGETITPVDLASDILYALKQSAEQGCFNGERVTTATITHPVTFGKKQIANLKEAAGLAGFDEVRLMEEPVAAIHGYLGSGAKTGSGILVFDFGGGTLDLAYLRKEEDGEWHMPVPPIGEELGGDDFDRLIYDHFERELQQRHGVTFSPNDCHNLAILNQCRLAKEKLSSQAKARFPYLMPESNLSMRFELDRGGLEALIDNEVLKASQLAQRMIERVKESGNEVDSVILIGGATRMPAIQETLKSGLPVKPMATMHADVAVAMGGSAQAEKVISHRLVSDHEAAFDWTAFGDAIKNGDTQFVLRCLRRGRRVDVFIDYDEVTGPPLLHAARWGQVNICRVLLQQNARINQINPAKETALHYAAYEGHDNVVDYLLCHGADINATDRNLNTPLHFAAAGDRLGVIMRLLQYGSEPDACNARQYTPLHMAVYSNAVIAAKLLIERGASLMAKTHWGKNALDCAVAKQNQELIRYISDALGIMRLKKTDSVFSCPLYCSAKKGDKEAILKLSSIADYGVMEVNKLS